MTTNMGNPAPLGLLAFSITTALLMYVDTGWVEDDFKQVVYAYALFFGGLIQLLVGIFELFKGSSFSFTVFGSYAAFWLAWSAVYAEKRDCLMDCADYPSGMAALKATYGVLSACYFVITLRKNRCLIVVFALLATTFFLLSAAASTGDEAVQKAAGYFGFFTAVAAFYTAIAELVNEEWGSFVLPGLRPVLTPERLDISAVVASRMSYERKSNALLLSFRGLNIGTMDDVNAIVGGVEAKIKKEAAEGKVHVIVDYTDAVISDDVVDEYWEKVADLQRRCYLSVKRFHVTSFGTKPPAAIGTTHVVRKEMNHVGQERAAVSGCTQ